VFLFLRNNPEILGARTAGSALSHAAEPVVKSGLDVAAAPPVGADHQTPRTADEVHVPAPVAPARANSDNVSGAKAHAQTQVAGSPASTGVAESLIGQSRKTQPAASVHVDDAAALTTRSIVIPDIDCRTLDRADLVIMVTAELVFDNDSLRDEILVKREQLKVLVRRVVSRLTVGDLRTPELRTALRTELNTLLVHGSLLGVTIRDLRMEKVNRS
jgi:flagellar basal body-associated protein FliL